MIPTLLGKSRHAAVLLSGGIDSMLVLRQVREHCPDIEVIVFRADMTKDQWAIIENLIRLWDLTVVTMPPQASYVIPNGQHLARVDEYSLGGITLPHVRDFVHDDSRCALEAEQKFLPSPPFEYDLIFVGTREGDWSEATGQPLKKAVSKINGVTLAAPIYYWTDEQVLKEAADLPYSKEWYEQGDEKMDTGNIVACSRCLCRPDESSYGSVYCPKKSEEIPIVLWSPGDMLDGFRNKFGFEVEK